MGVYEVAKGPGFTDLVVARTVSLVRCHVPACPVQRFRDPDLDRFGVRPSWSLEGADSSKKSAKLIRKHSANHKDMAFILPAKWLSNISSVMVTNGASPLLRVNG